MTNRIVRSNDPSAIPAGAPPGRVRLRDVAEVAEVSVSVVSRVLNRDPTLRIRDEKRERVLLVAQQLGYRPNAAGRSLRTHATGAIGVMLPKITQPFYADLIQGVEDECDEANLTPILGRAERLVPGSRLLARMVGEGRVDGFILQLADEVNEAEIDQILDPAVPRVLIQSHAMGLPGSVTLDVENGVRIAAEHLISLGHREIALAAGPAHIDTVKVRVSAFRQAMANAGLDVVESWITHTGFYFEDGQAAFRSLWAGARRPTAIVAGNVNLGLGVLRAANWADVDVPETVSIVAVFDSELAEQSVPPMTTVRLPVYQLGRAAVRQLRDVLSGAEPQVIVITEPPPELALRGSTAALRPE